MTRASRALLGVIGVLLFTIGVLVGQENQRSKFDKYLHAASVTPMDLAVLRANIGVTKSFVSLQVPMISYAQVCNCFTAMATVTDVAKKPLDNVRAELMGIARTTKRAIEFEFPIEASKSQITDHDLKMTFFELNLGNPGASRNIAEYADGKIIFK